MKSANVPGGRVNGERARIRQMNTVPDAVHSPPISVNNSRTRRVVDNALQGLGAGIVQCACNFPVPLEGYNPLGPPSTLRSILGCAARLRALGEGSPGGIGRPPRSDVHPGTPLRLTAEN